MEIVKKSATDSLSLLLLAASSCILAALGWIVNSEFSYFLFFAAIGLGGLTLVKSITLPGKILALIGIILGILPFFVTIASLIFELRHE